MTLLYYKKAKK